MLWVSSTLMNSSQEIVPPSSGVENPDWFTVFLVLALALAGFFCLNHFDEGLVCSLCAFTLCLLHEQ